MGEIIVKLSGKSTDEFWRLRKELLTELEEINKEADSSELESATKQYYISHINKDLICWGILQEDRIAAIGSLCLFTRIPYEENVTGLEGYILNIYTSPQFRGHGLANRILEEIIKYAQGAGVKRLWLNSSEHAKELYAKRGFRRKDNEMELFLS